MGPPHRNPAYASPPPSSSGSEPPLSPHNQLHSAPTKPAGTGMSPASRYQHNLKVLRRRDPSITSIFDQFSHVCVYHHNGKWEKLGYEGSMFLYERESYPPYGFYILNRMGTHDHIQCLYPEDNIGAHGSYLLIRSYPEFTDRRLADIRAAFNGATLDKFHDAYAVPFIETLPADQKGESKTIGLWMLATDSREPLIDTFTRLHSYIKRNQPYPQEFRYGPDRPPPSTSLTNRPQVNEISSLPATPSGSSFPSHGQGQPSQKGLSELDRLFAKMQPTPLLSAAVPAQLPTSNASVPSILTAISDSQSATIPSPPSSGTINTGLSLLDSIFASASVSTPIAPSSSITSVSTSMSSSSSSTLTIHNPIPTTTPVPHVLDQSTLTSLLGLPPSRTASAASTTYSTDARSSHSSSREGDNEDEDTSDYYGYGRGSTSDGYSTSSTVLDPDADEEVQAAGASAGRPVVAEPVNGHGYQNGRSGHGHGQGRRINGDVTPRPPMNGFITPPVVRQHCSGPALPSASMVGRRQYHRPQQGEHPSVPASHDKVPLGTERALVPFESDSELWPYSHGRATATITINNNNHNHTATTNKTNNTNNTHRNESSVSSDDDEIIELDFEDTSALSDPDAFRPSHRSSANGVRAADMEKEKRGRVKRKQSRKERAAEQARDREDIERSWDVPAVVPTLRAGGRVYEYLEQPESISPCLSPDPLHPQQKQQSVLNVNGKNGVASSSSSSSKQIANVYPQLARGQMVVPEAVRDSVIVATEMVGKVKKTQVLERNDFVREVLMLIHTDKAFVDSLYKEYTSRVG